MPSAQQLDTPEFDSPLRNAVRRQLNECNMGVVKLAKHVSASHTSVSQFLSGKRGIPISRLERMLDFLGLVVIPSAMVPDGLLYEHFAEPTPERRLNKSKHGARISHDHSGIGDANEDDCDHAANGSDSTWNYD